MVNTILFQVNLIRLRKYFSVSVRRYRNVLKSLPKIHQKQRLPLSILTLFNSLSSSKYLRKLCQFTSPTRTKFKRVNDSATKKKLPIRIVNRRVIIIALSTHGEIFSESCWPKTNLDCNYHFPIDLAPNRIPFGVKFGKVLLKSKFALK